MEKVHQQVTIRREQLFGAILELLTREIARQIHSILAVICII